MFTYLITKKQAENKEEFFLVPSNVNPEVNTVAPPPGCHYRDSGCKWCCQHKTGVSVLSLQREEEAMWWPSLLWTKVAYIKGIARPKTTTVNSLSTHQCADGELSEGFSPQNTFRGYCCVTQESVSHNILMQPKCRLILLTQAHVLLKWTWSLSVLCPAIMS